MSPTAHYDPASFPMRSLLTRRKPPRRPSDWRRKARRRRYVYTAIRPEPSTFCAPVKRHLASPSTCGRSWVRRVTIVEMRCLAAALFLAAPLLAQQCTYTLDKTTVNLPATASATNTVKVTATPEACRWIPNVTAGVGPDGRTPWLHLAQTSQQVFTGSGTFTFSADANPIGATRTGTITVVSENTLNPFVNVTQDAAACNFGFTPTAQTFPVNGGSGAVTVTANCAWAVSSNAGNWLTIPFTSAGGITNAVVPITVAANTCVSSRTATIFLSGSSLPKNLTSNLTQDGSASNFSLSGNSASVDAKESDNRFTVNTGTGCGWSATSDVTWMQITGGAFGTGNAPIAFHVIANTSAERTGSIHVTAAPGI